MATSAGINDEMEKVLECCLCLDTLNNPKVLECNHSFCKDCLDTMLIFRKDGSAEISCPSRCTLKTIIGRNNTTNDLNAPVQFKNVIDLLAEKLRSNETDSQKYNCSKFPKCKAEISVLCSVCCRKLCNACMTSHCHDFKVIEFIPIRAKVTGDGTQLLPWCEKHATFCTWVCNKKYICIYCKKRDHGGQRCDTIESLSHQVITWVKMQESKSSEWDDATQRTREKTEQEVRNIRESFVNEIKNRKLAYIKKLRDEEERLLHEFDSSIMYHFLSYPPTKPTDYLRNKSSFEIFTNKENIFKGVKDMKTTLTSILPNLSITFNEDTIDDTYPLGLLNSYEGVTNAINDEVTVSSSISKMKVTEHQMLRKELDMLREVCGSSPEIKRRTVSKADKDKPKLRGPVNGNECYFWRTTGCQYAQKCRYKHFPGSKGIDLPKVTEKYGSNVGS